jgi:hypothetical protein
MQKLFLVHLGYYDQVGDGVYESHTNIFLIATDFQEARNKTKNLEIVKNANQGFRLSMGGEWGHCPPAHLHLNP